MTEESGCPHCDGMGVVPCQGCAGTVSVPNICARCHGSGEIECAVCKATTKDEMKPGRELDELVAEKVMGWSDIDWHFDRTYPGRQWMGGNPQGEADSYVEEVPHFSTDIVAVWEIVKKFVEKEYDFEVYHHAGILGYVCVIRKWRHDTSGIAYHGDTAPEAICKAALALELSE